MLKKLSQLIDSPTQGKNSFKKDKIYLSESFDFLSLIKSWQDIAGKKLAEHTIPLKIQSGTLIVLSNHSAFANELSFMEVPLKKKIIEKFPSLKKSIYSIKFKVDSTHFQQQHDQFKGPLEKKMAPGLHPYSPEFRKLKKEAEEFFFELENLELKEKMISLYIQSFQKS